MPKLSARIRIPYTTLAFGCIVLQPVEEGQIDCLTYAGNRCSLKDWRASPTLCSDRASSTRLDGSPCHDVEL